MKKKTKLKDLFVIKNKSFKDKRGCFKEILREKEIKKKFPFLVMSYSKKNVIRGLHLQNKKSQGKFVSVIKGRIYDLVLDLRKNSNTYGKYFSIILSEKNSKSLYIPPGFAHGFLSLDKENIVCYSCTEHRSPGNEYSISYKDPSLKINWPKIKPILSKKDKIAKKFKEIFN